MEQETERINELKQELDKIERLKSLNELVKEKKLRLENEVYNLNYTEKDLTKKLGIKKPNGYIFYIDRAKNLTIMELEKFFLTVNLNNSEKIALDGKIGTYKNKPFFIVYAGIPLTLNIDEQKNRLCFDAKTFYYFIERVVSSKLTMREAKGFQITKTVIITILILVGAFFLFFTPTGKELLHNLMGGNFKI